MLDLLGSPFPSDLYAVIVEGSMPTEREWRRSTATEPTPT
jgi:hypothetical protein